MSQSSERDDHREDDLTEAEKTVLDTIREAIPQPVSAEELSAVTLLPIDIVVRATSVLLSRRLIIVANRDRSESELQLAVAGG